VGAPGLDFETWETTTLQVQILAVRDLAACGKTLIRAGSWEGHDFSRAVSR
jgi:hypothetical protein